MTLDFLIPLAVSFVWKPVTAASSGVILAGGNGTRLMPLTKVTNKHLLPVGRKPMILHPLSRLVEAGIKNVMVITGPEHMGAIVNLLGSGREYGCKTTYRVQDEAGGIAQALGLCEDFACESPVCVFLGDNIIENGIKEHVDRYAKNDFEYDEGRRTYGVYAPAMVLLKSVPDPRRFGVAVLGRGKTPRIRKIVEKPKVPQSDLAVVGIYFYPPDVFEVIRGLKPSARGELEITDVNNWYLKEGRLKHGMLDGDWTDAGTFESLMKANLVASKGE
jgi:glucose-1-phosphate thymidylyltransferase